MTPNPSEGTWMNEGTSFTPQTPLPIAQAGRNSDSFLLHRNLLIALIRACGGAVVFDEHDLLRDTSEVVLEQFTDDLRRITLRIKE